MRHSVIVDRDGAIQIPEALRSDLELHEGDDVVFEAANGVLTVRRYMRAGDAPPTVARD